ncbi:ABC transporter ATP-binding protein [Desulfofustis glycolicus]|uniref:Carbohydrate ABC transporter ATP-binding protein, CUT1 family (TC 3.A.1.1.-) n=1 Tax=Desulfofustis glycolicus DSM 9705 TaxID=1121409 RepID=A0A1M5X2U2_9BACT|nr:sn-glycerol-3-phosphate ABC transporter ATP-binding protein UgpC [Desulfofustis glycolicus]SHH93878.1 carbohydrate ABC transporter ATP-binding protein, CUT1 family (TC 3.A.1.1.-) [Desulfofustis glycolicus DSM 9705]
MAEIQLDNISKRFEDGTEVLKDVSLTIGDGEFFILLGPSGCGKSTLLNIIVGLETATTGEVRVDGRSINDLDPKDRNMAMVFQSYAIYPHMSVGDNLAFPLKLAGMGKKEIEERIATAAHVLELGDLLHRMPRSLSGGQRQRVAMGRAIVRQPDAFLLDEPLSSLDAKLRNQMRGEIARLHEQLATTMVYVTHDQTEATTLGQRLAVLHRGRLQQVGTPRELYNTPANRFVAGFIGSPPMNFFPGSIDKGRLRFPVLENDIDFGDNAADLADGRQVVVGLRPEHLGIADEDDEAVLAATVTMVEWLGADAYVHFSCRAGDQAGQSERSAGKEAGEGGDGGKVSGIVKIDPSHRLSRGGEVHLQVAIDRLHIFDREHGGCLHRTSKE